MREDSKPSRRGVSNKYIGGRVGRRKDNPFAERRKGVALGISLG